MARSEFYPYPWGRVGENVVQVYMGFVQPFARLFDRSLTMGDLLFQLAAVVGRIAVWSLIGGAITRVAVVYLGRDEQVSIYDAVRHSLRNWGWYLGAPLFPLLGIALLLLPLAVIGLLMRLDAGAVFAAAIWPVALLAGLAITILVLGLLGGWPLMWPTISAEEGSDSFEAFSRSYSYTFQRPLLYLFYAGVTILLGGLGWLLVDFFCEAVIGLTEWGVSFGAGSERLNGILTPPRDGMRAAAANILELWNDFVRLIAASFSYAYFFCAASAVYLLRRRDVDQTDFDEVFVPEEAIRYGLPPMPPPKTAVEE